MEKPDPEKSVQGSVAAEGEKEREKLESGVEKEEDLSSWTEVPEREGEEKQGFAGEGTEQGTEAVQEKEGEREREMEEKEEVEPCGEVAVVEVELGGVVGASAVAASPSPVSRM